MPLTAIVALIILLLPLQARSAVFTLPLSLENTNAIARSLFPTTHETAAARLLLTAPQITFVNASTIGLSVQLVAHSPSQPGTQNGEPGLARFTASPEYDPARQKIVLRHVQLQSLTFERRTAGTQSIEKTLRHQWAEASRKPLLIDIPRHPYLESVRNSIHNITYDGSAIQLQISVSGFELFGLP